MPTEAANDTTRTVVVLGASGFLGGALAELLVTAGHRVHAVGRSADRLAALRQRAGGSALLTTYEADLADPSSATHARSEIAAATESVDTVIASLGGWYVAEPTVDLPWNRWLRTLSENLTTHFLAAQVFSALPTGPAATYIALNGIASHYPCEGSVAISVTGAGQRMLIDVLASEARPPGVRYGEVVIDTPVVPAGEPADENAHSPHRVLDAVRQLIDTHPGPGRAHRVVLDERTADVPRATFDTSKHIGED